MSTTRPTLCIEVFEDRLLPSGVGALDAGPVLTLYSNPSSMPTASHFVNDRGDSSIAADPVAAYANGLQSNASYPGVPLSLGSPDDLNGGSGWGSSTSSASEVSVFEGYGFAAGIVILPAFGVPGGWELVLTLGGPDAAADRPQVPATDLSGVDADGTPDAYGIAGRDVASPDNHLPTSTLPESTMPAADASAASPLPGLLLAASSQSYGGTTPQAIWHDGSPSHLASDATVAAISMTLGQPGATTQPVASIGLAPIGQRDVAWPANASIRPTAVTMTGAAPAAMEALGSAARMEATSPAVVVGAAGLSEEPVAAVVGIDAGELDARVSSIFTALARFGVELASDLQQPEVYSWVFAAGLLGVGAAYTAYSAKKTQRRSAALPRQTLAQWEAGE